MSNTAFEVNPSTYFNSNSTASSANPSDQNCVETQEQQARRNPFSGVPSADSAAAPRPDHLSLSATEVLLPLPSRVLPSHTDEAEEGIRLLTRQASLPQRRRDPELEAKVRKGCERISENLHITANEPSLALYRLAEHVRKALPPTVESRGEVRRQYRQLQGAYYDAEYALQTVKGSVQAASSGPMDNSLDLLKNAILLQQQIKFEQQKRGQRTSIYQRFSAHIPTVDIPDLTELKETARETANRVESAYYSRTASVSSTGNQDTATPPTSSVREPVSRTVSVTSASSLLNNK